MNKLLQLDSSGGGSASVTRTLTAYLARKWNEANPGGEIIYRDLAESNLQFVNAELVGAFYTPDEKLTQEQTLMLAQSNLLLSELIDVDTFVMGIPMYNFSIPAVLKAYIDLVVRGGKTFSYEGGSPRGLLTGKKLFVITASGGDYSQYPAKNMDFVEPYVRSIMNFIGITDITFIKAHGHGEAISASTQAALESIDALLKPIAIGART